MKRLLIVLAILSIVGLTAPSGAAGSDGQTDSASKTKTCILKLSGMVCSACAARVEKTAKKIAGVSAAKVSQPKGTAEIAYDPAKTNPETIAKFITEKTSFKAEPLPKPEKE